MPEPTNPEAALVEQAVAAALDSAAERVARWGAPPTTEAHAAWLAEAARRYQTTNAGAFNELAVETTLERSQREV